MAPILDDSGSPVSDAGTFTDVPPGHGLLVSLDSEGACWMRFVGDQGLEHIHPHIHVPATLQDPVELGGGGSGVTIIRGVDAEFGDVVLKHGGDKDTAELFALATIEEQLRRRGRETDAEEASSFMIQQTPDFKYLYVSQEHLIDRGIELWSLVKDTMLPAPEVAANASPGTMWGFLHRTVMKPRFFPQRPGRPPRGLRLYHAGDGSGPPVRFLDGKLEVRPAAEASFEGGGRVRCSAPGEGYAYLQSFFQHLTALQKTKCWKFTLAQKTIGGSSPATGSSLLAHGKLHGDALRTLTAGYIQVMHHLQRLTLPSEQSAVEGVRSVVEALAERPNSGPADVPDFVDAYVGFAIKKNFHPVSGRFGKLRDMGTLFRSKKLILVEAERLPARLLGMLLQTGAKTEDVIDSDLSGPTAWESLSQQWRDLLQRATSPKSSAALARVWTCGLTDSGLHNLFLGEDRLWLFDMGEPALMTLPAFLTKFLMSFFHTLGMEETKCGSWVNRFEPREGARCGLSPATAALLPQVYEAFQVTLECFMRDVFDGEEAVRGLLMRYAVLQLLSDGAFCLERWCQKGGGAERLRPQAQSLEKWLWRALWDVYVATDVAKREGLV